MATVSTPTCVYDWLSGQDQEPPVRVYQYMHRLTGQVLYAAFWDAAHDGMHWAPEVTEAVCLLDEDGITPAGEEWVAGYLVGGLAP